MIDHRLGVDFPVDRREALWRIQQRVERRRMRLIFSHVVQWLLRKNAERCGSRLANYLVREYSQILTHDELKEYFGSD